MLDLAALDKALVWFDDVDISAFHSCVVVIYGSLFLSGIYYCLRVICCAAAGISELALEKGTKIKFLLNLEREEMKSERY